MSVAEFIDTAGKLQSRASELWSEEEAELQRGEQLMQGPQPGSTNYVSASEPAGQPCTPVWADYGQLQPHTLLQPLPSLASPASVDFGAVLATTFAYGMADLEGPLSGSGGMLGPLYHQAPAPHTTTWNTLGPGAGQQYYGAGMQHVQPQYHHPQQHYQPQYPHHQPVLGVHHDVEAFISLPGTGYTHFGLGSAAQPGMPKPAKQQQLQLQPGAHQFTAAPANYLTYPQEAYFYQHTPQAAWPHTL